MTEATLPTASELVLYQTEDGRTRIQCRFEGETLWLTQAQIGDLFQKDVRTINEHLVNNLRGGGAVARGNYPEVPDSSN